MRIATFYESRLGRNDGPPLYWKVALEALGHEVVHFSSQQEPDAKFGSFDLYLWVDWGEDGLVGALPYTPISMTNLHPSVYIASDTHLGFDYRLKKAREFDFVFCNQKRAVGEFKNAGVEANWLPHAVEPRAYPSEPRWIKKYDIGFVGFVTFEKRARMLDYVFKRYPDFWFGQRFFEEAAEQYRKMRIVLNTAAVDDINMRMFEVLATGSFLLTEEVPTLLSLFQEDQHTYGQLFSTYRDPQEAVDKIEYYLKHEEEREAIAEAGMKAVLARHTYEHRAKELLGAVHGEKNLLRAY